MVVHVTLLFLRLFQQALLVTAFELVSARRREARFRRRFVFAETALLVRFEVVFRHRLLTKLTKPDFPSTVGRVHHIIVVRNLFFAEKTKEN